MFNSLSVLILCNNFEIWNSFDGHCIVNPQRSPVTHILVIHIHPNTIRQIHFSVRHFWLNNRCHKQRVSYKNMSNMHRLLGCSLVIAPLFFSLYFYLKKMLPALTLCIFNFLDTRIKYIL